MTETRTNTKLYRCMQCGLEVQIVLAEKQELPIAECEHCGHKYLRPVVYTAQDIAAFVEKLESSEYRAPQDNRDLLFESAQIIKQLKHENLTRTCGE